MNITRYIQELSLLEESERKSYITHLEIKNYGSNELTETEMWILTNASQNAEYLNDKLKEAEELSLDLEAPEETEEVTIEPDLTVDDESDSEELSLDIPINPESATEIDSDTTNDEKNTELSLDISDEESSENDQVSTDKDSSEKKEIETSKEGIGILPLLGEIQEKLANGKPSEVELAALKALKKLVG